MYIYTPIIEKKNRNSGRQLYIQLKQATIKYNQSDIIFIYKISNQYLNAKIIAIQI